jgi:endonuclease III
MSRPKLPGPTSKAEFDLPAKSAVQKRRAEQMLDGLYKYYSDAVCELHFKTPHELLIATILSAQCTDVAVNKATPALFGAFPSPERFAASTPEALQPFVKSLGFFRNKAKSVHGAMKRLVEHHEGEVPTTMAELLELPGVARKTANVVLGTAFNINVGVVVDTHVMRLSGRFGLTRYDEPKKIELDLMALFPRPHWSNLSHMLIWHGRRVCKARGALCSQHPLCRKFCSNAKVAVRSRRASS